MISSIINRMWGFTRKAPRPNRKPREGSVAAFPYPNQPNFNSSRGFSCKRKGGPPTPNKNGYYAHYNGNTEPPKGWIEKHCEGAANHGNHDPRNPSSKSSVASDPVSVGNISRNGTAKSRARNARVAKTYRLPSANNRQAALNDHLKAHPHV
jgi:hypothetical protein